MDPQALAVIPQSQMVQTAAEVKAGVQLIQQVMHDVMKEGTHYGTIPGCGDKPTLLKAGAEKIMTTFRLAAEPEAEDLSTNDEVRYRVRVRLTHMATGVLVGVGVGECSSSEDKYRWKAAVCDAEFDETPEDRRRAKWKYGKQGTSYQVKQVRTVPADVANTVLKMAKKRALVDGVLTATAASDCFAQDLEDLPEGIREEVAGEDGQQARPARQTPRSTGGGKTCTEPQQRLLKAKLANANITEAELCKQFGLEQLAALPMGKVNDALAWITNPG